MKKLLGLLIAAVISVLVLVKSPTVTPAPETKSTIDYDVQQLDVSRFDENGLLISQIHSPYLKHDKKTQRHQLVSPRIKLHDADNTEWIITANIASSIKDGKLIAFDDHVIVEQHSPQTNTVTILTTEHLLYDPKNQTANTHTAVHIQQGTNHMDALGMKVTMKDKHIELLGKARGYYEPPKA